jgi:hypothetical protein
MKIHTFLTKLAKLIRFPISSNVSRLANEPPRYIVGRRNSEIVVCWIKIGRKYLYIGEDKVEFKDITEAFVKRVAEKINAFPRFKFRKTEYGYYGRHVYELEEELSRPVPYKHFYFKPVDNDSFRDSFRIRPMTSQYCEYSCTNSAAMSLGNFPVLSYKDLLDFYNLELVE